MINVKKCVLSVLVIVLMGITSSAFAFTVTDGNNTETVEISISGLTDLDLASVDMTIEYDNDLVDTNSYTVTDALGSIDAGDAEDSSGLSIYGNGFDVNIYSWLTDFSSQPDSFVLATITVSSSDEGALADINLDESSYINLLDQNDEWISDYTIETTANGFNISVNSTNPVPIPSAFTLLAFGLTGLTLFARRRA